VFKDPFFIVELLIITTMYIGYLCIHGCFRPRENVRVVIFVLFILRVLNITKTNHIILL
jgi:hypothetical protein